MSRLQLCSYSFSEASDVGLGDPNEMKKDIKRKIAWTLDEEKVMWKNLQVNISYLYIIYIFEFILLQVTSYNLLRLVFYQNS